MLAVPTYRLIRQDYLPTNVDDGQFEVRVMAPEGLSLAAVDDAMKMVEDTVRGVRGVKLVAGTSGGDFNGSLSNSRLYVQLVPHEERVFSWTRLINGILHGDLLEAFHHNFSQREVMTDVRRQLAKFRDLKISGQ